MRRPASARQRASSMTSLFCLSGQRSFRRHVGGCCACRADRRLSTRCRSDPALDALGKRSGKSVFNRACRPSATATSWRPSERVRTPILQGTAGDAHGPSSATTTSRPPARGRSTTAPPPATRSRSPAVAEPDWRTCGPTRSPTAKACRRAAPPAEERSAAAAVRHAGHDVGSRPHAAHRLPPDPAPGTSSTWIHPRACADSARPRPTSSNNTAATLEEVVEHYQAVLQAGRDPGPHWPPLLTAQPGVVPRSSSRPFTDAGACAPRLPASSDRHPPARYLTGLADIRSEAPSLLSAVA